MTAVRVTDVGIVCDTCARDVFGSRLAPERNSMTAAEVRRLAARQGWRTGVENVEFEDEHEIRRGPRLDYCPDHRPQEP